jgi:glycosyltransferase involved in cell wall biosynthesis
MKVSVVICTRNRVRAITKCLDAIEEAARSAPFAEVEIVVADNASDDGTPAAIEAWAAASSIPVRLEHEPRIGITIAKNRALHAAKGDLLVLTDDDCCMRDDYFVRLLQCQATDSEPVLRGGRVELGNPEDLPLTIKTDDRQGHWIRSRHSARSENLGNCLLGCNLTMSRRVLERLGPFDERFGVGDIPAGEDTDYIFRAYVNDVMIAYDPDLVVFHHHGRTAPVQARTLWRRYMIGSGALYAKYVLRCPSLCLQVKWDLKHLARELVSRSNLFLPEYEFSYVDKFRCYAIGATKFLGMLLRPRSSADPA